MGLGIIREAGLTFIFGRGCDILGGAEIFSGGVEIFLEGLRFFSGRGGGLRNIEGVETFSKCV